MKHGDDGAAMPSSDAGGAPDLLAGPAARRGRDWSAAEDAVVLDPSAGGDEQRAQLLGRSASGVARRRERLMRRREET